MVYLAVILYFFFPILFGLLSGIEANRFMPGLNVFLFTCFLESVGIGAFMVLMKG